MSITSRAIRIKRTAERHRRQAQLERAEHAVRQLRDQNEQLKAVTAVHSDPPRRDGHGHRTSHRSRAARVRGFLTLGAAIAGGYVLGARAGRKRYKQIRHLVQGIGPSSDANGWRSHASKAADRASGAVEDIGNHVATTVKQRAASAAGTVERVSSGAAETVDRAGRALKA